MRSLTRRRFIATSLKAVGVGALLAAGGRPSFAVLGQTNASWTPLNALNPGPSPRLNQGMIYDPMADRLVVFGGSGQGGFLNDTWTYSFQDQNWMALDLDDPAPAPRRTPATVYDPQGHRMVVYSGQGNGFFDDTWALDLASPHWQALSGEPRPAARYGTVLAFDPQRMAAHSFAGFTSQGRFEDLWSFSCEENVWTSLEQPAVQPGRRCLHAGAYDVAGDRFFIYGGQRSGALDDLWAYSPQSGAWREMTGAPKPAARMFTSLVADPDRDQLLVFGGGDRGQAKGDLWAFELQAERWVALSPQGEAPEARERHSAVWVPGRGMVVFGGLGISPLNDLWLLSLDN